jgi:2'-5' RNA ligase
VTDLDSTVEPDVEAYYAQRWQNLQQLDSMMDHWYWRPGWHVGRSFYAWHITFKDAPEVQRLAAFYQDRIRLAFLDPVPAEWLHLTMQGVGFTDEVSDHDIQAIVLAAQERCKQLAPFTLRLGPVDADPQGTPLAVRPWAPVVELRQAIRAAIADVWGGEQVPEAADGFFVHVTIFYGNAVADVSPLRQALTELRSTPPVETTVRSVSLIRLNRDEKIYKWETVAEVMLG